MGSATAASLIKNEGIVADVADFETLVRLNRNRVFRFALASLRNRDAAETVTQDCFVKAYRAREKFRGDCSVSTWLMQIAVNLVRDHVRNRRLRFWERTVATATPIEEAREWIADNRRSPEAQAMAKGQVQAVWNAAERLSQKQRTVFLLRFVEDMDLLEIASVTGMKEGTVKVQLFRALRVIRDAIGARV